MYPDPQLATSKLPCESKSIPSGPPSCRPDKDGEDKSYDIIDSRPAITFQLSDLQYKFNHYNIELRSSRMRITFVPDESEQHLCR